LKRVGEGGWGSPLSHNSCGGSFGGFPSLRSNPFQLMSKTGTTPRVRCLASDSLLLFSCLPMEASRGEGRETLNRTSPLL